MTTITIATRKSKLAMWQTQRVAAMLHDNGIETRIVSMETRGDKILDRSIAKIGSKGVFTEELEEQLASGAVDIAVHSAKDLPAVGHEALALVTRPDRPRGRGREVVESALVALARDGPNRHVKKACLERLKGEPGLGREVQETEQQVVLLQHRKITGNRFLDLHNQLALCVRGCRIGRDGCTGGNILIVQIPRQPSGIVLNDDLVTCLHEIAAGFRAERDPPFQWLDLTWNCNFHGRFTLLPKFRNIR